MIKRKNKGIDIFSREEAANIHQKTVDLLETTGVNIFLEEAREIFRKRGARVEGQQVYLPKKLIQEGLETVPDEFTLQARNRENSAVIGGNNTVLAPGYGSPFVMDYEEKKRRKSTFADYLSFTRLAGSSSNIDVVGGVLVEPSDLPDRVRHARMFQAAVEETDKCLMGSAMGKVKARESVEMAAIVYGSLEYIRENPVLISLINTNSPLQIDNRMLEALMVYAEYNQPMIIASLGMTGTTAPTTLAGALLQQNIEVLTGIILTQLINPGCPVVYGSASSIVDLKSGDLALGSPETAKMFAGTAQLARFYGIPSRGGGALTDSLHPDAQSGYESMQNFMAAVNSGFNFILHAAGLLENYMTMSFEKFMIDDEVCGMVKNFHQGINVDEDELAVDVISKVGSGGNYIQEEHTYHHMRDMRRPLLSSRERYLSNREQPDAACRAEQAWKKALEEYQAPELEKGVRQELAEYIERLS